MAIEGTSGKSTAFRSNRVRSIKQVSRKAIETAPPCSLAALSLKMSCAREEVTGEGGEVEGSSRHEPFQRQACRSERTANEEERRYWWDAVLLLMRRIVGRRRTADAAL